MMTYYPRLILIVFTSLLCQACNQKERSNTNAEAITVEASFAEPGPSEDNLTESSFTAADPSSKAEVDDLPATPYTKTVEIRKTANGYLLYRYGKPYFIKGAGGYVHFDKIKEHGGNSVRLWTSHDAKSLLDKAHEHGLTVTLGLNVSHERHGFNYNDKEAVAKQFEEIKKDVLALKDHPALLMWGIGNELDMLSTNINVWRAVNDIAKMIHELDPDHPTTTMLSVLGKRNALSVRIMAPHIDIISVNTFGALPGIPARIRESGWDGPYLVTEWGPTGFWEVPRTAWDVAIEENSSQKAYLYKTRYEKTIKQDELCLGSYAFYWGYKQERTPTWFSLFTETGEKTEIVDVLQYLWTGTWPANMSPRVDYILLDNKTANDDIFLDINKAYTAWVAVNDPEGDMLTYRWEVLHELTGYSLSEGGDKEEKPWPVEGLVTEKEGNQIIFKAPSREGPYRLYVYIYDGKNNVATANTPFYVIP
jgi:hypothetical protein